MTRKGASPQDVFHATWNLGGVKLAQLAEGIHEVERLAKQRLDFLSLQELPRDEEGWKFHEVGCWSVQSHRDHAAWRGSAVCYRTKDWSLLKKSFGPRGLWCKLRRRVDGAHVWVGSAHLTQGSTRDVHATEVHGFLSHMPRDRDAQVFGVDANTPFAWIEHEGEWQAIGKEGKGEDMIARLDEAGAGLTAPPPHQKALPTCRPRRHDVTGRHIDVVGGRYVSRRGLGIIRDSYMLVGSDHDAVLQALSMPVRHRTSARRANTRPKWVWAPLHLPDRLNQEALKTLAVKCTRPYGGCSYTDPPLSIARRTRSPPDWKQALRARDFARKQWKETQIAGATNGDWRAYREVAKRGVAGWEGHFADKVVAAGKDPHVEVHEHFCRIYQGDPIPPFPGVMVPRSPDFTVAEFRDAMRRGKLGKATGGDGVPHELLKALVELEGGETRMLEWFNRLLHGDEPIPEDWGHAVMVLLPKCARPELPKHLRPICLGSSANKVYARMLLNRAKEPFKYSGPFQNLGEGRQTVDYLWTVSRLMSLEAEWKFGIHFLKLDIEKAFDSLNRSLFLHRLRQKMGDTEELRSWWHLFTHTQAGLTTAWGEPMGSGVRQGSVESPQAFASAMDWIMHDVQVKHGWDATSGAVEGLQFAEAAFVDDCFLWGAEKVDLELRVQQLIAELALWGLRVNAEKSQYYPSQYATDTGALRVGSVLVEKDDRLDVMGIPFQVGIRDFCTHSIKVLGTQTPASSTHAPRREVATSPEGFGGHCSMVCRGFRTGQGSTPGGEHPSYTIGGVDYEALQGSRGVVGGL